MYLDEKEKVFLFDNAEKVRSICRPLFEKTKINYFDYQRHYYNGDYICLSTNPFFIQNYLADQLYPTFIESSAQLSSSENSFVFMSEYMPLPSEASKYNSEKYINNIILSRTHEIYHRIYIIELQKDYFRLCGFGVPLDIVSIYEFYLNSLKLLNRFITFFEQEAFNMINGFKNNPIYLPGFISEACRPVLSNIPDFEYLNVNLIPKKYHININSREDIMLTKREMECLVLTLRGQTAKEASQTIKISHRTVEKILQHVHQKTHGLSKNRLFNIIKAYGIFELYEN